MARQQSSQYNWLSPPPPPPLPPPYPRHTLILRPPRAPSQIWIQDCRACFTALTAPPARAPFQIWTQDCRASFTALTRDKVTREAAEAKAQEQRVASQADDLIDFVQLKARKGLSQIEIEDEATTGERGGGE